MTTDSCLNLHDNRSQKRMNMTRGTRSLSSKGLSFSSMMRTMLIVINAVSIGRANAFGGQLYGIGYREQELQVAKGTTFNEEDPTGIAHASFAGDTNIFIKGDGLVEAIQSNIVVMYSHELEVELVAPPLTENDAFGSNPNMGFLQYRLPSPATLFGFPKEQFDSY